MPDAANRRVDRVTGDASTVYAFAVGDWRGELHAAHPDDPVQDAQFVLREEAVARLQQLPWVKMREPVVAHLRHEAGPGALWLYHDQPDGSAVLVGRLADAQSNTG